MEVPASNLIPKPGKGRRRIGKIKRKEIVLITGLYLGSEFLDRLVGLYDVIA